LWLALHLTTAAAFVEHALVDSAVAVIVVVVAALSGGSGRPGIAAKGVGSSALIRSGAGARVECSAAGGSGRVR
jgi:hypothetical protein